MTQFEIDMLNQVMDLRDALNEHKDHIEVVRIVENSLQSLITGASTLRLKGEISPTVYSTARYLISEMEITIKAVKELGRKKEEFNYEEDVEPIIITLDAMRMFYKHKSGSNNGSDCVRGNEQGT